LSVNVVDLKRDPLPVRSYDVITCFDVLEHVPDPVHTIKTLRAALGPGGVLFVYAPFGEDAQRPMHIVHDDRVWRLMRFLGVQRKGDWEDAFPPSVRAPSVYVFSPSSVVARCAYYVYDEWMQNSAGDAVASLYRRVKARRQV
jgi:SAM-dependent methyltransferase